MNIEKSIEILKALRNYNKFYKEENKDLTITITLEAKESIDKAIERLLTAYEKEKEKRENQKKELAILNAKQIEFNKLVNTVNSYKGQFKRQEKEIEELNKENARQHELICNIHQNWEDKIKAKIEDLKENSNGDDFNLTNVIMLFKSLLEKE